MIKTTVLLSVLSCVFSATIIRHGNQYKIKSKADGLYVTSGQHTYRPDFGVYTAKVYPKKESDTPYQIWDMIKFTPNGTLFWVFPRAGGLNEITVVPQDKPLPEKNLIGFIQNIESPDVFYLQSDTLKTCLQNNLIEGVGMTYEKCSYTKLAQQFELVPIQDDE